MLNQFSRTQLLLGLEAMQHLSECRVAVFGIGGVLGQLIPVSMDGIDFCLTALFVTIFVDQWEKAHCHFPAVAGLMTGIVCLMIFGESSFILPALLVTSALLVVWNTRGEEEKS